MGVAVENSLVTSTANNIGCMTLSFPFSYLGVNVGGHMSRIASWDVVINKVLSRLSKWKMKVLSVGGVDLLNSIKKKVGNGKNTMFWDELWKGEVLFKNLFPRLYALESVKNISVADKMVQPSLEYSFRRNIRGGTEQVQMASLLSLLEGLILPNMIDRWMWLISGDGEFSVSSPRHRFGSIYVFADDSVGSIKAEIIRTLTGLPNVVVPTRVLSYVIRFTSKFIFRVGSFIQPLFVVALLMVLTLMLAFLATALLMLCSCYVREAMMSLVGLDKGEIVRILVRHLITNAIMDMKTKFDKLVKFEGQDFRRWQKKMHFLLTTLKVVYVLSTPSPEWHEDETLETTGKRMKWDNDDYICRG
nr:RNA-directed DNA polymerase, eukaryota, reverse transcriptase zinc-binding domain protein [Tanacetum cinerariifolium]